jgi:hypothetical protein
MMVIVIEMTKRRLSASHLEKKKEKNKNGFKAKVYVIGSFLFCTQDTIEGVSDLESIAVLLKGGISRLKRLSSATR